MENIQPDGSSGDERRTRKRAALGSPEPAPQLLSTSRQLQGNQPHRQQQLPPPPSGQIIPLPLGSRTAAPAPAPAPAAAGQTGSRAGGLSSGLTATGQGVPLHRGAPVTEVVDLVSDSDEEMPGVDERPAAAAAATAAGQALGGSSWQGNRHHVQAWRLPLPASGVQLQSFSTHAGDSRIHDILSAAAARVVAAAAAAAAPNPAAHGAGMAGWAGSMAAGTFPGAGAAVQQHGGQQAQQTPQALFAKCLQLWQQHQMLQEQLHEHARNLSIAAAGRSLARAQGGSGPSAGAHFALYAEARLWAAAKAASPAAAAALADRYPDRYLRSTCNAAEQRQGLRSLLAKVQVPPHTRQALHHAWSLDVVPTPGSAAADSLNYTYQWVRALCNTSTREELLAHLQRVPPTHPQLVSTTSAPFLTLPDAALLHIFQLLCDSSGPEAPGTCWVAPVCKQWHDMAGSVKGLRVVFNGEQWQQLGSQVAWLRRYVHQVEALVIANCSDAEKMLEVYTGCEETWSSSSDCSSNSSSISILEAAAWGPFPLKHLVVTYEQDECEAFQYALPQLLAALPHLQHLQLPLWAAGPEYAAAEAVMAPLRNSTSLTSLVVDGPDCSLRDEVRVAIIHRELLDNLPRGLRSLSWMLRDLADPDVLQFGHLSALTHLRLSQRYMSLESPMSSNSFMGLPQQLQLELYHVPVSEEGLRACSKQLVLLGPTSTTGLLGQLRHLRSLDLELSTYAEEPDEQLPVAELLQQAPPLVQLSVPLFIAGLPRTLPAPGPWVLQHYNGFIGLQRLTLGVLSSQLAPQELTALKQLKQLKVASGQWKPPICASWAQALAGLVNLEVLSVPAEVTALWRPWLTGLTRLAVLELVYMPLETDVSSAAPYITWLLTQGTRSSSSSSSCSSDAEVSPYAEQVQIVCVCSIWDIPISAGLRRALRAAVPALPPKKHLFTYSWHQLAAWGVELWPAPVAARLRQLVAL